jgi:hypothetical protein
VAWKGQMEKQKVAKGTRSRTWSRDPETAACSNAPGPMPSDAFHTNIYFSGPKRGKLCFEITCTPKLAMETFKTFFRSATFARATEFYDTHEKLLLYSLK